MKRDSTPTPTSFRLSEDIKRLLSEAAKRERRTLTSMVEVAVLEWCETHGLRPKRKGGRK